MEKSTNVLILIVAVVITAIVLSLGLTLGFAGIGDYRLHIDLSSVVHIISVLVIVPLTSFAYCRILWSYHANKGDIVTCIRPGVGEGFFLFSIITVALTLVGAITALIYASLPHFHLCGLVVMYFGYCAFDCVTLFSFRPSYLEAIKGRMDDEVENPSIGIKFLLLSRRWLLTTDLPTFLGLAALHIFLIFFYILSSSDASTLHTRVHDIATGATAFHIVVSQLHFAFTNRELMHLGEF